MARYFHRTFYCVGRRTQRNRTFRTAISFWGLTIQIPSTLSPKRDDCSPERVKCDPHRTYVLKNMYHLVFIIVVLIKSYQVRGIIFEEYA